ncbi:uncharacterized protein LAJ45_00583 [Morchella importuna]|uniref:Phosphatases II n=1 Tax=Morchella conica CCBAS932 TaxID=1392247 RepID=A0A3N4L0P9_9PEZI|nr:uncharacterized protein LAJ45_00583 [Morchella importuna]KAH8155573.1 hypothetical protein LAJ45_00583 [Morchella importuna]RPB16393.1 phosphatases II [Morchella conica CCBAS932]
MANAMSLQTPSSHQPNNVYTAGLPAPPRILIPPPTLNPEARQFDGSDPQPTLEHMVVSPSSSILPTSLQDWKYESRREAQQILTHLWLGPLSAAKSIDFIKRENITLLLAVRSAMTAKANLLATQLPGVRFESIDVSGNQQLIAQFQRATDLIDEHYLSGLGAERPNEINVPIDGRVLYTYQRAYFQAHRALPPGGKTLLFCESGNERSAAVAAAYIMQHLGGSAVQAIQHVQSRRFCVCFDDGMKWLLQSYEPIWMARRQAFLGNRGSGGGQPGSKGVRPYRGEKKRTLEEYDDEGDSPVQIGSRVSAPFADHGVETDMEMS